MKLHLPRVLVLIAVVVTGCKEIERSRDPLMSEGYILKQQQKKIGPSALPAPSAGPTVPTAKPIVDVNLRCDVTNVLFGMRDRADVSRVIKVSESDEGRSETLSTNSENTVFLESSKGIIQLRVEARKGGYKRGQIEFPITAKQVTLSPDNQFDAVGFVDAHCAPETAVAPAGGVAPMASAAPIAHASPRASASPSPVVVASTAPQKFKWTCSASGFKNELGEEISFTKKIEFSSGEASKSVLLVDAKRPAVKIEIFSEGESFGVRNAALGAEGVAARISAGTTHGASKSFTFYLPMEGDLGRYKVSCTQ